MTYAITITLAVLTGLICVYLWKRLVWDTTRPGRGRLAGTTIAVLLGLLIPATMIAETVPLIAWPGFVWLAVLFYLFLARVILEAPVSAARWWLHHGARRAADTNPTDPTSTPVPAPGDGHRVDEPVRVRSVHVADDRSSTVTRARHARPTSVADEATPGPSTTEACDDTTSSGQDLQNPARPLVLARGAAIFAGLTASSIAGYGMRTALGPPRLDRVQIPLAKLPRSLDELRLAVVSDIHLGPISRAGHARRIVEVINSVDADIVAVVGDLVDGTVAELGDAAAPLRGIRARQGTYFVTGNHEYFSGYEPWIAEVESLGIRPLRNERVELGSLDLAGVNDVSGSTYGDAPDFPKTFADRDPTRPVVLMAHQPIQATEAAKYGVGLQVSGHTHGGQMFPFDLVVKLQQPIVSGYGEVDGVPVYVTNGAGFWGPPVRIGAPPQVTLIELRTP